MTKPKEDMAVAADESGKLPEGEFAVELTSDISGGVGNHKKGTRIRHLSHSAFNTLVQGGFAKKLSKGADVAGAVDASAPIQLANAPVE